MATKFLAPTLLTSWQTCQSLLLAVPRPAPENFLTKHPSLLLSTLSLTRQLSSSTTTTPPPQFQPRKITHPPRLFGKIAIITGSSSGLGRAIALAYASHGAALVVCADLRPEPREGPGGGSGDEAKPTHELVGELYGGGGSSREDGGAGKGTRAVFVKTDVGVEGDLEACVAEAVERGGSGRLDIMVNNAGLGNVAGSPLCHELELADWERTMRVNSTGVYLGSKHALRQFLSQDLNHQGRRGWIVNVSSMLGYVGIKGGTAAYCASKGAVLNLTRQLSLDYASHKININALCPGFTRTAMTRANYENEAVNREMVATTPWGEWGVAEEVARGAVFLASEDAAWVTGVGLPVDGGYLAQ